MPGGNWRVRSENALAADFFDILAADGAAASLLSLLSQQLQSEKSRMAFIHVKPGEIVVTQCAQHADTANAEYDFLAKAVVRVASVQRTREIAIKLRIRRQISVQKVHRYLESVNPLDGVLPAAKLEPPIFNGNAGAR